MGSAFTAAATVATNTLVGVFGVVGSFVAPPAAAVEVRVVLARVDEAVSFAGLDTQVRAPGWRAEIPHADVPVRPRAGVDTLTVDGVSYAIRDVSEDIERTIWVLDISEAA